MKTALRKTTALLLALLTVFGISVCGLGASAAGTYNLTLSTAFYTYNATAGAWEKATVLHPNQAVKVRVGVGSDFVCNNGQLVLAFDKSVLTPAWTSLKTAVINSNCAAAASLQSIDITPSVDSAAGLTKRLKNIGNITEADAAKYGFVSAIFEPVDGQTRFTFDGSTWLFEFDMTVADAAGKSAQVIYLPKTVCSTSNINGYSVFYKFISDVGNETEGSMVWYNGTPTMTADAAYVQEASETHSHIYTEQTYIDATCDTNGISVFTCTCGAVQGYGTIPAGHTYGNYVFDGASAKTHTKTCGRNAKHTVTEACSFTSVVTTPATCTEKGVRTYTCSVCGGTYTEDIAPINHNYGNFTYNGATAKTHTKVCANDPKHTVTEACSFTSAVTTPATCTEKGVRTYTCSVCGGTYTEDIAPINHTYGNFTYNGATAKTHTKVCANDPKHTVTEACSFTSAVTTPATCQHKGVRTYTCSACGGTYTEDIPYADHIYSTAWSSDANTHWHTCICEKGCFAFTDSAPHSDEDGDGCCDVCGKKFAEPYSLCTLKIRNNTGSNTVDYRNGIQLTAVTDPATLPENTQIVWYVNGVKAATGTTFVKTEIRSAFRVTVQLEDADGNVWHDKDGNEIKDEEQINVKAGFFKKIIAFFRWLFKRLKTTVQALEF